MVEATLIKTKSLQDYLEDNPGLKRLMSYEEYEQSTNKTGFDDSPLIEAYRYFRKLVNEASE